MNAMSVPLAKFRLKTGSRPRAALLAALAAASVLGAVSGTSQAQAGGDQPIVASLNPPPVGLACDAAAAATSVYFQFTNPPFQVSQISLYLDGRGVPQDAVDEHWPTVTLSRGLHPGSNTIDIVANGGAGQQIQRRMVVQVGGASDGSAGSAQVACDDAAAAQPAAPDVADQPQPGVVEGDPEPVAVQDSPQVIYDTPPQPAYDYGYDDGYPPPVYFYSPYPLVAFGPWVPFVPFFGFGFFFSHYHPHFAAPHMVVNNNYGHGGWNGRSAGYGGDRYAAPRARGNYSTWRGRSPVTAYRGNGQAAAPRSAQSQPYHASNYARAPQYRPAPQQSYRPAPQQTFRPAPQQSFHPSAPGGGGHSAPASHGGGGHHR